MGVEMGGVMGGGRKGGMLGRVSAEELLWLPDFGTKNVRPLL